VVFLYSQMGLGFGRNCEYWLRCECLLSWQCRRWGFEQEKELECHYIQGLGRLWSQAAGEEISGVQVMNTWHPPFVSFLFREEFFTDLYRKKQEFYHGFLFPLPPEDFLT